jgi:MinD-like ATPase involved in chromosome partitioning or flagellar assembly
VSEASRVPVGEAFGAASRASDYVEEDAAALVGAVPVEAPPTAGLHGDSGAPRSREAGAGDHLSHGPVDRSTSVLFGGIVPATSPSAPRRATMGLRGLLAGLGLPIAPGVREAAVLAATADAEERRARDAMTIRQATWTRAVSILVGNPKGGTGKTPTALLLGGIIASIRGGSTAIVEFSDDPGALNYRAEGAPRLGLGELVRDVDAIRTAGQLIGYTAPQTSFANVIGSTGRRERLTGEAVVAVSRVIDEFYGIRVMDTGNQPTSSAFRGAVSVADVLVIPVLNAGDSVLEAIQLLEELREDGGHAAELAQRVIAIRLTDGRPESDLVRDEVARLLREAGVQALFEIPYDAHIAERGQLTLGSLAPSTRDAFAAAAAAVVRILQEAVAPASDLTRKA